MHHPVPSFNMLNRLPTLIAVLLLIPSIAVAQITLGGIPFGLKTENNTSGQLPKVTVTEIPALDVAKTRLEDTKTPGQNRFAAPVKVDIAPEKNGTWNTLPNGDRLWQCRLRSAGAMGLILIFDRFQLPEGSRLFAYIPDGKHIEGAFTKQSCLPDGQFLIGVLPGESVVLEYFELAGTPNGAFQVHLNRADCVYEREGLAEFDYGDGLPCNFNVNCPQGNAWKNEKRGVARIMMNFSNGTGWCTGSLIANTAGTFDPYFLSAHHCQLIGISPNFNLWRFDFDYEAPSCPNPTIEPGRRSVLGCERVAFRSETDMLLLRLTPLPTNYPFYFNGWNKGAGTTQAHGTFIHHPSGDIKKISIDSQQLTIYNANINWGGIYGISQPNSHWRVNPDYGVFQPGSSGCPLFDPQKRIIGQLHGGVIDENNPCNILASYFGRFNQSWDQGPAADTRLMEWLDPTAIGNITQNGYVQPIISIYRIGGKIQTHWGTPMPGVKVVILGPRTDSTYTDSLGNYSFNNLMAGFSYNIKPRPDATALNGVTTQDLALISKHILNLEAFSTPWKILSADANNSGTVTTLDIVGLRRLILGIDERLALQPAWRFHRTITVFNNPSNPFIGTFFYEDAQIDNLQRNETEIDFYGIKIGDVNNSSGVK